MWPSRKKQKLIYFYLVNNLIHKGTYYVWYYFLRSVCVPLAISGCIYPDMLEATEDARVSSLKSDNLTFSHIHCGGIKEITKLYT